MVNWVYLLALIALTALAGGLLVAAFLPRGARWNPPLAFAALALGVLATGWLALLLAEFDRFGRWPLLGVLAVLVAGLLLQRYLVAKRPTTFEEAPAPVAAKDRWAAWEWLMLAVWVAAAGWLFFRPHETITGGADAGVYVSLGAEMAKNGGFGLIDKTLAALPPDLQAAVLRPLPNTPGAASYLLPGFYVTDAANGRLTPQFYPLHPVWQAVAFSATDGGAAGVRAELWLTGLWMALGTLAVYLTARDVGRPLVGALTLAGLTLVGLQVWFGRYPTSEALTQFLLWVGVWSAGRWLGDQSPPRLWAFVAGGAFGTIFLVRIDSLVLLPVFSALLVWRWARGWRAADAWFAAPLVLLVSHSLLHGHFLSAPYFYETVGYGLFLLERLWPILLLAAVIAVGVLWWLVRRAGQLSRAERLVRPALAVLALLWLLYAAYGWFLRPELNATILRPDVFSGGQLPVLDHLNWPRLGWYLTPLGVGLGVVGAALMLWWAERRTALLLALGLLFAVLYLWNISANPHHVYVMRRYVPAVVPFFILCGAWLLGQGWRRVTWPPAAGQRRTAYVVPALSLLLALGWLAGLGWAARGFVSQVDYDGLTVQVDTLAAQLPPGAVLLFDDQAPVGQGDVWGTPLRFVYGHDVFTLRRPPAEVAPALVQTIKTWQNSGRPVVWIGPTAWLDAQGLAYRTEPVALRRVSLESSYDHKPQAINDETTTLTVSYLESE